MNFDATNKPHQRIGAKSNAQVGRDFELAAKIFLKSIGLELEFDLKIPVGINGIKKEHSFDLGCLESKVIVECKSHKWTAGNNVPSAKLTVWNEAMYYFLAAPTDYRKIMFVLHDFSEKRGKTLADYYLRTYSHLVPKDVEFWEYDELTSQAERLL
jgi:hypothetical protein